MKWECGIGVIKLADYVHTEKQSYSGTRGLPPTFYSCTSLAWLKVESYNGLLDSQAWFGHAVSLSLLHVCSWILFLEMKYPMVFYLHLAFLTVILRNHQNVFPLTVIVELSKIYNFVVLKFFDLKLFRVPKIIFKSLISKFKI